MRAKVAQEKLVTSSGRPYSIVHATQFFEFGLRMADEATDGGKVRVPPVLIQPMASADVAAAVSEVAIGAPINGIVEIGGPEAFRFADFVGRRLRDAGDAREVVEDADAHYFGAKLSERSLVPGDGARLGPTRLDDWLAAQKR
jgi:uncharacterized protein YbjT (DUF2867 family)